MATSVKKQFSQQFSMLEVPPAIDQTTPEALASLIQTPDDTVALFVVDVRQPEEFHQGHIARSRNCPLEAFAAETFSTEVLESVVAGKRPIVIFASLQSPDLDVNAALSFSQRWEELGMEKKTGLSAGHFTQTLLGGVCFWLQEYRNNANLTQEYNAEAWEGALKSLR